MDPNQDFVAFEIEENDEILSLSDHTYHIADHDIATPDETIHACRIAGIPLNIHDFIIEDEYLQIALDILFGILNKPVASLKLDGETFNTYWLRRDFFDENGPLEQNKYTWINMNSQFP